MQIIKNAVAVLMLSAYHVFPAAAQNLEGARVEQERALTQAAFEAWNSMSQIRQKMKRRRETQRALRGTWKLKEFNSIDSDGEAKPWCEHPHGFITYSDSGHVTVGINCKTEGDSEEPANDPKRMVFYMGTYEVKSENLVVHKILNSADVNIIGKEQERHISISGDELTITGKYLNGSIKLTWERTTEKSLTTLR